jgi:hypothetical protein
LNSRVLGLCSWEVIFQGRERPTIVVTDDWGVGVRRARANGAPEWSSKHLNVMRHQAVSQKIDRSIKQK